MVTDEVTSALTDARNTLAKTATGRIGSDELTIPRAAFDSVLRNIDKARVVLKARAETPAPLSHTGSDRGD